MSLLVEAQLPQRSAPRQRRWRASPLEALALVASPVVAFYVLRLRAMAPLGLPDPSMHSTFIIDPRDIFLRYSAAFTPTARLREGARVGFLVPAHLAYVAFGAVGGFFVFRYVLVLVAVVPAYVLLKRLYGTGAGVLAVVVIMSSPVLVTTWGTDFPDSAVVSYMIGGIACVAVAFDARRRARWLAGAAVLFTLAVWALASTAVLVAVTLLVYLIVRLWRDRHGLASDVGVLALVAALITVALGIGSWFELGQLNFITPTIASLRFLAQASQERLWHSNSWGWAPYDTYLLVLPAMVVAWWAVFARRWRDVASAKLFVGLTLTAQVLIAIYLQFLSKVQVLEMHYFSSILWAPLCLALAVMLSELTQPLLRRRWWQLVPAGLVLAVPLAYEADQAVPAMSWLPAGAIVAGILVAAAIAGSLGVHRRLGAHRLGAHRQAAAVPDNLVAVPDDLAAVPRQWPVSVLGGVAVVVLVASSLVLTVAPSVPHARVPGTVADPWPAYATALGGPGQALVDQYRIVAEIPGFVGNATYSAEQLLTCTSASAPWAENALGIFHAGFDLASANCPAIGKPGIQVIEQRHAAQLLMISVESTNPQVVIARLHKLDPVLVRQTVLRSGGFALHLWLFDIGRYLKPPARPSG